MSLSKKVSIVLPTYNGQTYIRKAVDSCLSQTYKNIELIIVDDGSDDKTAEIIKSYISEKVKYIKNEKNLGLSEALNTGFKQAKGDYLAWASDDNFYDRGAIETLVRELEKNPEIGLVYSNFYQIDEKGRIRKRLKTCRPKDLDMKNCVGPCFVYRKEVYEQIGGYNADLFLAEDYDYWLRTSRKFKLKKINNYLCYYRLHEKSLRSQNRAYKIEEQAKKASDPLVRPAMRFYHEGKVLFRKEDYRSARKSLMKAMALEPFSLGIFELLVLVFLMELKELLIFVFFMAFPSFYIKSFYKNNTGRTYWNGKKACFGLSFDCDYAKDIEALPLLLDALSEYSVKASFACVGKLIEKYPNDHMRILKEGHEIINHTYTHPDNEELNPNNKFNELSRDQKIEEIEKCHNTCKNILKYEPAGFRTPHFGNLHTEDVYGILYDLGYKYSSSVSAIKTISWGMPFNKGGIEEFPLSPCPKHPNAVFDTWHSLKRGNGKHTRNREFYNIFKNLLDIGIKTNSYINLYFDPQDVAGLEDFKLILDYIKKQSPNIWIATYKDLEGGSHIKPILESKK